MSDPTIATMKTVQVSANLLFGKVIDSLAVLFLLAGFGILIFIAFWYFKFKKKK